MAKEQFECDTEGQQWWSFRRQGQQPVDPRGAAVELPEEGTAACRRDRWWHEGDRPGGRKRTAAAGNRLVVPWCGRGCSGSGTEEISAGGGADESEGGLRASLSRRRRAAIRVKGWERAAGRD